MKRAARLITLIILMSSVLVYGATALITQDCELVEEAVLFHCGGSDADACLEAVYFYDIACRGLPGR